MSNDLKIGELVEVDGERFAVVSGLGYMVERLDGTREFCPKGKAQPVYPTLKVGETFTEYLEDLQVVCLADSDDHESECLAARKIHDSRVRKLRKPRLLRIDLNDEGGA